MGDTEDFCPSYPSFIKGDDPQAKIAARREEAPLIRGDQGGFKTSSSPGDKPLVPSLSGGFLHRLFGELFLCRPLAKNTAYSVLSEGRRISRLCWLERPTAVANAMNYCYAFPTLHRKESAMVTVTILCLANSRRHSGHCIAGKVFHENAKGDSFKAWVRPVGAQEKGELLPAEIQYDDGSMPQLLDLIEITVEHEPEGYQTENGRISTKKPWRKIGTSSWSQAKSAVDAVHRNMLWVNSKSSQNGINDLAHISAIGNYDRPRSLYLIYVEHLELSYCTNHRKSRQIRGTFQFNECPYKLVVTDLAMEEKYLHKEVDPDSIQDALLCVSLAQPPYNSAYASKLIAGVITPDNNETT